MGKNSAAEDKLSHFMYVNDVENARKILEENKYLLNRTDYFLTSLLHTAAFYGQSGARAIGVII